MQEHLHDGITIGRRSLFAGILQGGFQILDRQFGAASRRAGLEPSRFRQFTRVPMIVGPIPVIHAVAVAVPADTR
ncbi:MAG: hypothetical protein H7245_25130 [Candidatus Saccharibacteria bacterium]|nr:hypothetical protein [Pseudorhodobacter sp.]